MDSSTLMSLCFDDLQKIRVRGARDGSPIDANEVRSSALVELFFDKSESPVSLENLLSELSDGAKRRKLLQRQVAAVLARQKYSLLGEDSGAAFDPNRELAGEAFCRGNAMRGLTKRNFFQVERKGMGWRYIYVNLEKDRKSRLVNRFFKSWR